MRIGELARRTGASPRSLRYYEQQGLLTPDRGVNGYREYPADAVARVRAVRALLAAGLTLADVHAYRDAGCLDTPLAERSPCSAELVTARRRLDQVERRLTELRELRDQVARHHADVSGALRADEADRPAN